MASDNRIYWIWLAELLGQGSRFAVKLINLYGSPFDVYETPVDDLLKTEGLSEAERSLIKKTLADKDLEPAKRIMDECATLGIGILTPDMNEYPKTLCALKDMPLVLYCKGTIPNQKERLFISIVGTRNMSDYGRRLSYSLGYGIALGGAVIVSGMALGSDSMAMAGAMDVGAPVVAVLGCGVDVIYPREHREMYYKTIANGAVISEYPPGTPPVGVHFPVRNRIISGLSEGTVVVEGKSTSGSLITARHAVEQGKKVFAVPGKVGEPGSEGTFHLLYEDALPCATAEDVLAEFQFLYPRTVNVDYVHAKLRNFDFEKASLVAMERARIGVRGESQYYGTGAYGGRARDFKKKDVSSSAPVDEKEEFPDVQIESSNLTAEAVHVTPKTSNPSRMASAVREEKVKKASGRSIFDRFTHKNTEKSAETDTKSKEKQNITTGFTLNMLDENDIKVYNIMQPNVPVIPDSLVNDSLDIGSVMCSLSTLELAGLVESAPGGYFTRVGENLPTVLIDEEDQHSAEHETLT